MKILKRLLAFIVIVIAVLIVLQLAGTVKKKSTVSVGPGIQFYPEKPLKPGEPPKVKDQKSETPAPVPKPESKPEKKQSVPEKAEKPVPEAPPVQTAKQETKKQTAPEQTLPLPENKAEKQSDNKAQEDKGIIPEPIPLEKGAEKNFKSKIVKPGVVKLSQEEFIELDRNRDRIPETSASEKKEGAYGWGIVGKYEDRDLAVRTLGGIPFAIDKSGPYHYRIYPDTGRVKATAMISAAYSNTGIEARDSKLRSLVRDAARARQVSGNPEKMEYYYLFSRSTERYVTHKVVNAFEWFIKDSRYDKEKAEDFRKNARIRLDVWQALRDSGGEMGIAVPVYFDYNGNKLFLADDYFKNDAEFAKSGIIIDKNIY